MEVISNEELEKLEKQARNFCDRCDRIRRKLMDSGNKLNVLC